MLLLYSKIIGMSGGFMDIEKIKVQLSKKQKFMVTSVICFFVAIIGTAYAWINHDFLGGPNPLNITSASVSLMYQGTSSAGLVDISPGETIEKTFIISNYSEDPLTFNLYWTEVENTFVDRNYLFYTLEDETSGEIISSRYLPSSNVHFAYGITIGVNEEKNYKLSVTYILDPKNDQLVNENKYFIGDIAIDQISYSQGDIITTFVNGYPTTSSLNLANYTLDTSASFCTDGATIAIVSNQFQITNKTSRTTCDAYLLSQNTFTYTGGQQTYTVPEKGNYKLEVWGAQGGQANATYVGGYGGYSVGTVVLNKDTILYINVGGQGSSGCQTTSCAGGYNGGGSGGQNTADTSNYQAGGGGATHIAKSSGLLSSLSSNPSTILIVGGGGGGGYYHVNGANYSIIGASAGGFQGTNGGTCVYGSLAATGGTQSVGGTAGYRGASGSFGVGGTGPGGASAALNGSSGGGGGFYGGGSAGHSGSGGGSGYIGNSTLINKYMYCYNCTTSSVESTLTYTTTNYSATATANYAKQGSGYVRITGVTSVSTNNYNLVYIDHNNGNLEDNTYAYYYPGDTVVLENPTHPNSDYIFNGWEATGGSTLNNNILTVGSTYSVVKAKWRLNGYGITYNCNGGSGSTESSTHIYNVAKNLSPNGCAKIIAGNSGTIYEFLGWSTSSSATTPTYTDQQSVVGLTAVENETLIFYAIYDADPGFTCTSGCVYEVINEGYGNWKIKFTSTGSFNFNFNTEIEAFLVGGGGGGGYNSSWVGGGGGGGGLTTYVSSINLTSTSYPIIVGAGGSSSGNGSTTSGFGYSAAGGTGASSQTGGYGGSGGGAGGDNSATSNGGNGGSYGHAGYQNERYQGTPGSTPGDSTCEFRQGTTSGCNSGVTAYAGGGGGGGGNSSYGLGIKGSSGAGCGGANTGCGGLGADGASGGGRTSGAYGIIVIRNKR